MTPVGEQPDETLPEHFMHDVCDDFIWKHSHVFVQEPESFGHNHAMITLDTSENGFDQSVKSKGGSKVFFILAVCLEPLVEYFPASTDTHVIL